MNPYGVIILAALLGDFALHLAADRLNLRRLPLRRPADWRDLYSEDGFRRFRAYRHSTTRLRWAATGTGLSGVLLFWFAGGFARLDLWVQSFDAGPVVSGVIYIGILTLLRALLGVPFGIFRTFVIEERFGFNRTTWQTYLKDMLKVGALAAVIGGPLLAAIIALFVHTGPAAWWIAWAGVSAYLLCMQYVAPTWILPLFNRFEPLEPGPLRDAVFEFAHSLGFPLQNVLVMDGSRRTGKANAFFTGFGHRRRVVLYDTLLQRHGVDELVAVLAHEIGHYRMRHIILMLAAGIAQTGLMFFLLGFFISSPGLHAAFFVTQPAVHTGLVFFGLLFGPLDFGIGLGLRLLSRRHEYAADHFAARTTGKAAALAAALRKMASDHLADPAPHPLHVWLYESHPPLLKRVAAIENAGARN